jgi:hypothetical protein
MTGDPKCPACDWISKDHGPERQEPLCTGRPGCVQKGPDRIPEYKPLGGVMVPEYGPVAPATEGGADIVERLRDGLIGDAWGETDIDASWGLMAEAAAEIARLRAENERLTAIVTDDNGPWRLEAAKKRIAELEAEVEKLKGPTTAETKDPRREAAQKLADHLGISDKGFIGLSGEGLYVYTYQGFRGDVPSEWMGWPVKWHKNVGRPRIG